MLQTYNGTSTKGNTASQLQKAGPHLYHVLVENNVLYFPNKTKTIIMILQRAEKMQACNKRDLLQCSYKIMLLTFSNDTHSSAVTHEDLMLTTTAIIPREGHSVYSLLNTIFWSLLVAFYIFFSSLFCFLVRSQKINTRVNDKNLYCPHTTYISGWCKIYSCFSLI